MDVNDPAVFEKAFIQVAHYRQETLINREKVSAVDFAWRSALCILDQEERFMIALVVNDDFVKQLVQENSALLQKAQKPWPTGSRYLSAETPWKKPG